MQNNKQFFLISFIPAIAYWYLEEKYGLKIALIGGLGLAILEIALEKVFTKHVHTISKLNFYLILILGTIALIGQDGIWFKLQPFFTGTIMGSYLLYRIFQKDSLMIDMMKSMNNTPSLKEEFLLKVERDMAIFLIAYAFFMAYIAFYHTTAQWTFFKTIGFYIATLVFFVFEIVKVRLEVKRGLSS